MNVLFFFFFFFISNMNQIVRHKSINKKKRLKFKLPT